MNDDLKQIKKHYGEDMAHLCRELFPTLLEEEGLLYGVMEKNFAPNKALCNDIIENYSEEEFKNYIYSFVDVEAPNRLEVFKTPAELLSEAGYDLYECKTDDDIQSFKKYYDHSEELCTFRGKRLERCYVFFAVKKNVDDIRREDFKKPNRQDLYGTSVISIQFTKGNNNTVSIKNRYNHKVNNPDSTFSNNLDNIIGGLTESFEREYHLNINNNPLVEFELPNYVRCSDQKLYKYNYEIDNMYYCPNNIIIDHLKPNKLSNRYLVIDYFIVDLVNKTIDILDESTERYDSFVEDKLFKIEIEKDRGNRVIKLYRDDVSEPIEVTIDKCNRIIEYKNNIDDVIGNNFLQYNGTVEKVEISNVKEIGKAFLYFNNTLSEVIAPNVSYIGNNFLAHNMSLETLDLPNIISIGDGSLYFNRNISPSSLIEKTKSRGGIYE